MCIRDRLLLGAAQLGPTARHRATTAPKRAAAPVAGSAAFGVAGGTGGSSERRHSSGPKTTSDNATGSSSKPTDNASRASCSHAFRRSTCSIPCNRGANLQPKTCPSTITGTADGLHPWTGRQHQSARTLATDPGQPRTALHPDAAVAAGPTGAPGCQPCRCAGGRQLDGDGAEPGIPAGTGRGQSAWRLEAAGAGGQQQRHATSAGNSPDHTTINHSTDHTPPGRTDHHNNAGRAANTGTGPNAGSLSNTGASSGANARTAAYPNQTFGRQPDSCTNKIKR